MIANKAHAQLALLCQEAEDMYRPGVLAADWALSDLTFVGYITAVDDVITKERVYYGFVAKDATQYYIVFRGTENFREWIEDLEAELVDGPAFGKVEKGFWDIFNSVSMPAAMIPVDATITITGHSLGAALATYSMAAFVSNSAMKFNINGVFFASPKPGDKDFVNYVDTLMMKQNYVAYAFVRDIVPHLPPIGFSSLLITEWLRPSESQAIIENTPACNHDARSYAKALDYDCFSGETTCVLGRNA